MIEIEGRYAKAKCFASVLDQSAMDQIRRMCDSPAVEGSRVRIMPDAHAGAGCTIGTTITVADRVSPSLVGVDLGCGVLVCELGRDDIDLPMLDSVVHAIPSGRDVWDEPLEDFDLSQLECHDHLRNISRLACSLGTLGGGNHFIEVDVSPDGEKRLVIHSGSRNLGLQVARYYQELAVKRHSPTAIRAERRRALVARLKAEGRTSEIKLALRELDAKLATVQAIPDDLAWLEGPDKDAYLHDAYLAQDFATRNRELMAQVICERAHLRPRSTWLSRHNYVDPSDRVLRKGAISAHEGEKVIIPLNMRDGSVIARGRGNVDWNCSAPHGAGRAMSRREARAALDLTTYQHEMEGVYTTSVTEATIDEAPDAYKPASAIMEDIRAAVDVEEVIRPIYNFKAQD